jgi:succinate dehydrogenase/fumarate reductase flavoprotein subunit
VSLVPQGDGTLVPFPHYLDRGKPGVIAVDLRGTRFVNESICYHDFVQAMVRASSGDGRVEAFLIADRRALQKYGLGVVPPSPGRITPYLRSGYLLCSDSLDGLGEQLGLPAGSLPATVRRFNAGAASGNDPEFGKGADAYQRASGDAGHGPNPCVAPLVAAPFYAVRIYPGDIATFAGLRTDECARVTDANGDAIEGLYAAGNDMMSVMGGRYPAAGITVGSAMTFGHVAAKTAASLIL